MRQYGNLTIISNFKNALTILESVVNKAEEYPATVVLDLTANIFLKNEECAGMNYREWPGIIIFYILLH